MGKAVANGTHIEWEYIKRFEDLSQDDINEMSAEQMAHYEDERIKKNVLLTCDDLANRVQDSPGPKGSKDIMSGYTSEACDHHFFNDVIYLTEYIKACINTKRNEL